MAIDPYYDLRVIGLHFNGADNSTTFTDNSPTPKTFSASGNAKIVGNVGVFDGTGDFLSSTISNAIGTGNFTIYAKIKVNSTAAANEIFCIGPLANVSQFNLLFEISTSGALRGAIDNGTGGTNLDISTATGLITAGTTYHVAFIVSGTAAYLFIDGVLQQTGTITGTRVNGRTEVRIGRLSTAITRDFNGTIDEFYLWKAIALNTSSFTPPATQFDDFLTAVVIGDTQAAFASNAAFLFSTNTDHIGQTDLNFSSQPDQKLTLAIAGDSQLSFSSAPSINVFEVIAQLTGSTVFAFTSQPLIGSVIIYQHSNATTFNFISTTLSSAFTPFDKKTIIGRRYLMTMPGAPDLVVPISSINGRLRSAGQSTLTVVCPDGINYVTGILERVANGFYVTLIETYSDGTQDQTDSDLFTDISPSHDRGARNFSVTLTGNAALTLPALPRRINIQSVQYQGLQVNGARRVRSGLDKDFLPKDIALLPSGEEIIIDAVTYTIGTRQMAMELTEAA